MKQGARQAQRRDRGPRLTGRDLFALCWIAEQYAIRLDQLQILLARLVDQSRRTPNPKTAGVITPKRTLEVVRRWELFDLVVHRRFLVDEPPWVWLGPEGLRLVALSVGELRMYEPTPGALEHLYRCNEVRLFVESRYHDITWASERQLRAGQPLGEHGVRPHLPDAILADGKCIAVEVELAPKSYERIDKVLWELATAEAYGAVWYFCLGRAYRLVERRIAVLREHGYGPQASKFAVYDLEKLRGVS